MSGNTTLNWEKIIGISGITEEKFEQLNFDKKELQLIYDDFCAKRNDLNALALYFVNKALGFPKVHSARYRVKDPEHLIAKIIRKIADDPKRKISLSNYNYQITDLIGLRILHLFKKDHEEIDTVIRQSFKLTTKEKPIIYFRKGDTIIYNDESKKFKKKEHNRGYRSIHYVIESSPTNFTNYIEIQVRTIFEEGWSEIDHKLLYPSNLNDPFLTEFTMILNSLSGSADSMATLMVALSLMQKDRDEMQRLHDEENAANHLKIKHFEDLINKSNLSENEKAEVISSFSEKETAPQITIDKYLKIHNSDAFKKIDNLQKTLASINPIFMQEHALFKAMKNLSQQQERLDLAFNAAVKETATNKIKNEKQEE